MREVRRAQRAPEQPLVEEPQPPHILAGGLRDDRLDELTLGHSGEHGAKHTQIDPVVLEREHEVVDRAVAGVVRSGVVDALCAVGALLLHHHACGAQVGGVREPEIWQAEADDQRRVPQRPGGHSASEARGKN